MEVKWFHIIKKMKISEVAIAQAVIWDSFRKMMDMMVGDISCEPVENCR